jgi:hypothetical protein
MKDREWCKKIEDEIIGLKNRVDKMEGKVSCSDLPKAISTDIEWPEADIGGLHFNEQKTHAVFELKEDGNYYSRDILFVSARDTDDRTGRDILTEYLDSEAVKEAFQDALETVIPNANDIRVFLPKENQGVKKFNGVTWGYWLLPRSSSSAAHFDYINFNGSSHNHTGGASSALGCAPAFCVGGNRHG